MRIIITGVAGFIGFSLAYKLLEQNHKILGIDNLDDYYSVSYKKKRLLQLKKFKNFFLIKKNINKIKKIDFKNQKIDMIFHLAAQAGVRYSFIKPKKYIETNMFGFLNILDLAKKLSVKKILYASSSSVYGDSKKFPLKENVNLKPKNIYAISKQLNEKNAELYSNLDSLNLIGLRFFTVFGEWGRPDMFMMKLFKAHVEKKVFYLNNYGNHTRDFTYINDVVDVLLKLMKKNIKGHKIFNVCSNRPQNILKIVNTFNKKNLTKIKLIEMHKADVLDTHGDNSKIKKYLNLKKFSNFYDSFFKVFEWYKKNKINLIS